MTDERRHAERLYIPATVTSGGRRGRVLDVSANGVLIEFANSELPGSSSISLIGKSEKLDVHLDQAWVSHVDSQRLRVGGRVDGPMHDWVNRELKRYNDLSKIKNDRYVSTADLKRIAEFELANASEEELRLIESYETIGERKRFLWGWLLAGTEVVELPGCMPDARSRVRSAKLALALVVTLVDDVADHGAAYTDVITLWNAVTGQTALRNVNAAYRDICERTRTLWLRLWRLVERLPNFAVLRDYLRFDCEQIGQSMGYAALINQSPAGAVDFENETYQPHNMAMLAFGTMDLMAIGFDFNELGSIRELLYRGQAMGRIGNAVTTWERELPEGDFSSQFFTRLSELSGITVNKMAAMAPDEVRALEVRHNASDSLLEKWKGQRDRARSLATRIRSLPGHEYVDGLERFLSYHLSSRGLK